MKEMTSNMIIPTEIVFGFCKANDCAAEELERIEKMLSTVRIALINTFPP
jgi:hypothetical protein